MSQKNGVAFVRQMLAELETIVGEAVLELTEDGTPKIREILSDADIAGVFREMETYFTRAWDGHFGWKFVSTATTEFDPQTAARVLYEIVQENLRLRFESPHGVLMLEAAEDPDQVRAAVTSLITYQIVEGFIVTLTGDQPDFATAIEAQRVADDRMFDGGEPDA